MGSRAPPSGSTLTFLPPFDSSEDAFGVSGPDEGFGIGVGFFDEPVDCSLKVGNRPEHSTLEAPSREVGEEAFDGVEPGRRGRREVKRPAGMPCQPFLYLGMFVGRVVVDDSVDRAPAP